MSFSYLPAPTPTPGTPPDKIIPSSEWLNTHTGNNLVAVCGAFMGICALFVGLRGWSRWLQRSAIGLDDYLIYAALLACWVSQATCAAIVPQGGVGTRAAYWEISDRADMIAQWAKYIYVVEMCYLLAACLTKLAIIAIFLRILRDSISRKVAQALVCITVASYIAESVACSLQCVPFQYQWDKKIQGGHCFNQIAFYEYLSIPNILTDLALLILPIPTVRKLHASKTQKLQLTLAFMTGSFGIVASILRFTNFFTTNPLADPTFNSVVLLTWTVIEPAMYLISACLPTLRPLLTAASKKVGITGSQTTGYKEYPEQSRGVCRCPPQSRRWLETDGETQRSYKGYELSLDDKSYVQSPYRETHIAPAHVPDDGQILHTTRFDVVRSDRTASEGNGRSFFSRL